MNGYERITRFIDSNRWIFAKTMAYIPHWYCLLKEYGDKKEFTWASMFMRENGRKAKFGGKEYTYFHLNGYKYWDMDPTPEACDLINRDKYKKPFLNDGAEPLQMPASDDEYNDILSRIVINNTDRIIEIGAVSDAVIAKCGFANTYSGCTADLRAFKKLSYEHPEHLLMADRFENIYFGTADVIVALFGAADQIRDKLAAERLKAHTDEETKVFLMYEKEPDCTAWLDESLGLSTEEYGKYKIHYRQ